MTTQEKTLQLKNIIINELDDEIGSKVILLDCPYHGNVGDILIWEGECEFFKITNKKILSQHSLFTYNFPDIPEDVTICLHGGGNFGDLYRTAQDFRIKVINRYPNNKIVILPQSVYYDNKNIIEKDAFEFTKHENLTICARDLGSYEFLCSNFNKCKIMLIPDMAFCIDFESNTISHRKNLKNRIVFFKRLDKELVNTPFKIVDSEERDWPTFEKKNHWSFMFMKICYKSTKIKNRGIRQYVYELLDFVMQKFIKFYLITLGVNVLKKYDIIYTTRLHAMILGVLMNKTIYAIDNSTKKLSDFYKTWLYDCKSIELYKNNKL